LFITSFFSQTMRNSCTSLFFSLQFLICLSSLPFSLIGRPPSALTLGEVLALWIWVLLPTPPGTINPIACPNYFFFSPRPSQDPENSLPVKPLLSYDVDRQRQREDSLDRFQTISHSPPFPPVGEKTTFPQELKRTDLIKFSSFSFFPPSDKSGFSPLWRSILVFFLEFPTPSFDGGGVCISSSRPSVSRLFFF